MKCCKYRVIFILILFVTGCATNYVPPPSGPTATIVANSSSTFLSVFQNAKECTGVRGNTSLPWAAAKPLVIQANKMNTFLISYSEQDYYSCRPVAFSFTPRANNQYQVTFEPHSDSFFGKAKCILKLTNLTTQKDEKFLTRKYHQPLLVGEGTCEDKISDSV